MQTPLEQLLRRDDIWRGHSRTFLPQEVVRSGFNSLDNALLNKGWPKSALIDCAVQHSVFSGEWLLFTPVIKTLCDLLKGHFVVLLNPPALPFAHALIQANIPLDQLMLIESERKQDFIACFLELTRSKHCPLILAWQTPFNLSYAELRKCQLACTEGSALYCLFRPEHTQNQHSPAPLRVALTQQTHHLHLKLLKQRGLFKPHHVVIDTARISAYRHTENKPPIPTYLPGKT